MLSMIAGLIFAGGALTLTLFLVMHRTGLLLRFLGYAGIVDIVFTVFIFALFAHTFSGTIAGTFAGLFMAIGLTVMRNMMGYERLQRRGFKLVWVYHPGKWRQGNEQANA